MSAGRASAESIWYVEIVWPCWALMARLQRVVRVAVLAIGLGVLLAGSGTVGFNSIIHECRGQAGGPLTCHWLSCWVDINRPEGTASPCVEVPPPPVWP